MNKPVSSLSAFLASVFSLLFLVAGCGRDDVKVYRVAKEDSQPQQQAMPPGHPDINASPATPRLTWTLPSGWQEGTPSTMRVATFTVPGKDGQSADVAVIPLPPGGSELDLVNMWRSQMQLGAATAADAEKESQPVTVAGIQGKLFDIASEAPVKDGKLGRILVAMINKDGMNWFFKMTGEESLVREQKDTFVEFLKSVSFEPGEVMLAGMSPHGLGTNVKQVPGSSEGKPNWTVPVGWREVPAGEFLVAKFTIAGEGGAQAAVNVSSSGGDGGGLLANVNRWRRQISLPEVQPTELNTLAKPLEVIEGNAVLTDMSGTDARSGEKTRVLAVMVSLPGQAWFYKLMGDDKIVEHEKETFAKFVASVRY